MVAVVGANVRPVVNASQDRPIVVRNVDRVVFGTAVVSLEKVGVVTCTKGAALLFNIRHIALGAVVVTTSCREENERLVTIC